MNKKGLFILFILIFSFIILTSPTVYTEETNYNVNTYDYGYLDSLDTDDYTKVEKTVINVDPKLCTDGTIYIYHFTYLREIRIVFECTYKTFSRALAAELIRSTLYNYGRSNKYERFTQYQRLSNDSYRLHKYDNIDDIYIIYDAHVKINK